VYVQAETRAGEQLPAKLYGFKIGRSTKDVHVIGLSINLYTTAREREKVRRNLVRSSVKK
jgi:hypothetical protein